MKTLLDTCILAVIRRPQGHAGVKEAVKQTPDEDLYLSVLTIGEVAKGLALLPAGPKKRQLTAWLRGLEVNFADRILLIDRETSTIWGEITARAERRGITIPAIDGLLAATALRHGLRLMTSNVRHFEATGVIILDLWERR